MRIAMIGQKGFPAHGGGVERHVHDLAVRLVQSGHTVTVYGRNWYNPEMPNQSILSPEGVLIRNLPSIKTKHLDAASHTLLATLYALFGAYDVIHYHGVGPALFSWIPRIFCRKTKVIATFHSIDRKQDKWGSFARLILKFGEWSACYFPHTTIAVSKMIQAYTELLYNRRSVYIPNAVETTNKTEPSTILRTLGLTPKKYVLMVARLIPDKEAHTLIAAWQKIQTTFPELKLVIVGASYGTDAYVRTLHDSVRAHDQIVLAGHQEKTNLSHLYQSALLQVHPSKNEGLPLVVLEGMNAGLPMIVSDIPAHTTIVTDSEYHFVTQSAPSLATTLEKILLKPATELQKIGQTNQEVIKEYYNWEEIITDILRVYGEKPNPITAKVCTQEVLPTV